MNLTTQSLRARAVTLALMAPLTSAVGQQRVTVDADEAPYASEQVIIYEAMCPSGKYRLTFNQNDNRVEFELDGSRLTKVDISTSSFGATFLEKALYGKFYSTCPKAGGIRVYFYGIEPKEGSTLKTVKYSATIGSDGAIIRQGELVEEHPSGINYVLLRKQKQ